jgi:hypothetical protein
LTEVSDLIQLHRRFRFILGSANNYYQLLLVQLLVTDLLRGKMLIIVQSARSPNYNYMICCEFFIHLEVGQGLALALRVEK